MLNTIQSLFVRRICWPKRKMFSVLTVQHAKLWSCVWIEKNWYVSELRELVMDREAWHAAIHGVTKSRTRLSDWTELNWRCLWFDSTGIYCVTSWQKIQSQPQRGMSHALQVCSSTQSDARRLFLKDKHKLSHVETCLNILPGTFLSVNLGCANRIP